MRWTMPAETGRTYRLSVAVNTSRRVVGLIDWQRLAPRLDWVFMMNYDYAGAWDGRVSHHTALKSGDGPGMVRSTAACGRARPSSWPWGPRLPSWSLASRSARPFVRVGLRRGRCSARKARLRHMAGCRWHPDSRRPDERGAGSAGHAEPGWQRAVGPPDAGLRPVAPSPAGLGGLRRRRAGGPREGPRGPGAPAAGTFAWELTQDGGDLLRAMNLGGGHRLVRPASAHKARGPGHPLNG